MRKPPLKLVKNVQNWLFDYLDTEIDPYDFGSYLQEWAKESRVRLPEETYYEDLKPAQQKKFEKWLVDNEKGVDWVSTGDIYAPAYLYFNEVSKLPVGTWCVHFTNEGAFDVFEQGTTLDGLALSSHKQNKDTVDCKKNLSDEIGSAECVFGFAFTADQRNVLNLGQKYGRNAVLFQIDGGVRAWHVGDEEYQVIFPLCSEYNVIPLVGPEPGDIRIETEGGEEMTFQALQEVIDYVSKKEAVQANPSRRLVRVFEGD
jgi:hypothetical protein